jgi:hypothetical protein
MDDQVPIFKKFFQLFTDKFLFYDTNYISESKYYISHQIIEIKGYMRTGLLKSTEN